MGPRARSSASLLLATPVIAAIAVTACSLLTSTDGLSDGLGGADDGAASDGLVTLPDGAVVPKDEGGSSSGGDAAKLDAAPSPSDLYAAAVLADKPLGYWRLEETSGTVAKDETHRNDGTYLANPLLGQPGVAGGRAAKLPKDSNARVAVMTGDFGFTGNAPYTVEIWVRPAVFKDYQWLGGTEVGLTNGRRGWSLLADSAGLVRYEVWNPNDAGNVQTRGLAVSSTPIALNAFAHVVLAYTGTKALGYVNGVLTATFDTGGICPPAGSLLWGCRGDLVHCLDDWIIDELAIYDFPLDGARAKAHYDLGK